LEKEVEKILLENKINYINKCTSSKLKWLERQHLDFYLPDYKIAIECQGIQHFEPRERFGGKEEFVNTLERDKRKKEKCIENNINIIYYSSEYIRKKTNKNLLTKNNLIKYIKKCQDLK
jgi:very-short-patch-repair endonuclease